jgi:DNA-binding transcriptional ArsR family regulator
MAEIAALVGDPARAIILDQLTDGRALTATELALSAGITPQTASAHLGKLLAARLVVVFPQGRHRYYRLASSLVANMLEGIMAVAAIEAPARYRPRSPRDEALRLARTCYDHLAGRLGVALADALVTRGHVVLGDDGGEVTSAGFTFFGKLGIDLDQARRAKRRVFCRPCIDWTERRSHLAGTLGAALAQHCLTQRWLERKRDSRAVIVTPRGREALRETFDLDCAALAAEVAARDSRQAAA